MLLTAVLPALRRLRSKGKSCRRTRKCGARRAESFKDTWKWPSGNGFLFPNRTGKGHVTKDIVCHAIIKARKNFSPPKAQMLNPTRVRSHSGRHRMINDLKTSGVPSDAAMVFARIKHKKTFDKYGQMDQEQSGQVLNRNGQLKRTLKALYS